MADPHRDEIAKLEELFAANPDGRIFTHLAEGYRKAGDLSRARETVERGLERHAEYASAHVVLGRVLRDQGEAEGAERAFRRVLELDPENRGALRGLGDIALDGGRAAEALEHYRALLLLDPGDEEVEQLTRAAEVRAGGGERAHEGGDAYGSGSEYILLDEAPAAPAAVDLAVDAVEDLVDEGESAEAGEDAVEGAWLDIDEAGFDLGVGGPGIEFATPGSDEAASEADHGITGFRAEEEVIGAAEQPDVGGGDAEYDAPVVTETMADLYARQGLHDKAAAVYRELLRDRVGDERLEAKLREVEDRAAETRVPSAGESDPFGGFATLDDDAAGTADGVDDDPLDGLVPAGFDDMIGETVVGEVEPLAGLESAQELDDWAEADVQDDLDDLDDLDEWAEAGEQGDPAQAAAAAFGGEYDSIEDGPRWPSAEEVSWIRESLEDGDVPEDVEPLPGFEPVGMTSEPTEESGDDADAEDAADLPFLAAGDPGHVFEETEPAAPTAAEPTIGEYLRALLVFGGMAGAASGAVETGAEAAEVGELSGGADGGSLLILDESLILAEEADAGEAATEDEYDRLFGGTGEALPGPADSVPAMPAAEVEPGLAPRLEDEGGGDDDEDLEMFRAWLQNLKH